MRRKLFPAIPLFGILIHIALGSAAIAADANRNSSQTVTGVVKDAIGRPLKDAAITLQNSKGRTIGHAASNVAGEFSFAAIGRGTYAVIAKKKGFRTATAIVTVGAKPAAPVAIALEAEAAVSLAVVAKRIDRARNVVSSDTGGSGYKFTAQAISQLPQGNDTPLNQVLLQAPGVVQDSYSQLHIRGDHGNLQYRINGVQLPEGITGFGQVLSPRFARSVSLLTGALPAQFGLRTAGIVDIRTRDGALDNVASVEMYGGQRGTTQPSFEVGGSEGNLSYFATGQYYGSDRGLEPPTSGPTAIHDTTNQGSGFGYLSYLLNSTTRISLITGTAIGHFQIPASPDQTPAFALAGVLSYPSAKVRENQFEQNYFTVAALQGTVGAKFDYQVAPFSRYSSLSFNPDHVGDLIYDGVASRVFRSDLASGLQIDTTYRACDTHTIRLGSYFSGERAEIDNHSSVFDTNGPRPPDVPFSITADKALTSWIYSGYLQDEWRPFRQLTINAGVRFDLYDGIVRADQASPRVGLVYNPFKGTTVHAGYARFFTPPPTELVSLADIEEFQGTTGAPPSNGNGTPSPERAHYFDAGATQEIVRGLNLGIDSYYKKATDLLDEGQFGAALVYSPFNYAKGRVWGVEFTASYSAGDFYAYNNFAYSVAQGTQLTSGQFNFARDEARYISSHYVFLDHDQTFSNSAGAVYRWKEFMFSVDGLYGSGLGRGFANTGNLPYYIQVDAAISRRVELQSRGALVFRAVIVNLNDRIYQVRNGSGIGVFAAQYGPRRALYGAIKWELPFTKPASTQSN